MIFDCDGVLVDSEPHSRAAWVAVLRGYGLSVGIDDVVACTGMGFRATHERLTTDTPGVPGPDQLWPEVLAAIAVSFERVGLETFDDATRAVDDLAFAGVSLAVASSSPRDRLDMTLAASGVGRRFSITVAGDEVERPKPAPDVLLAAATLLGTSPHRCVAVEDHPLGAAAAVAAGMRVVAVARDTADAGLLLASGAALVDSIDAATIQSFLG